MAQCVWPEPLTAPQLKRLEEHKYSSSGRSMFEPPLQIYWNWLVEQIPTWVAPNTLTIIGLLINVATTLILMCYCPSAREEAPGWAFLLSAFGLFIYQSLDAIDGKQARRTNSSSPLGELFDHGCDAVSTGTCIAVRMGTDSNWMFFCGFIGMFMFYCAHWQTYVSGTLRFGLIDVTEVQVSITIMYLMTAFGGTGLWDYRLISLVDLVRYCSGVCIQIASHLQIQVFRITPQVSEQVQNHHD
ncbi:Cholinephosphotransferase 1 [Acipenser ruthenus]|uniref:Cholinephosphotransferase 1 n=1 Tax=Acipenser ruthenus TaxID=7906 RepID=A0A444U4Z6_ACIRT|nr:Cholinephosphotransferase 1 [Acipenser ruthenus]